jgi:alpha-beta hydrolase superfamily lysophospholipase
VLIERIDDLVDDAEQLVTLARAEHPDLPLVLIGHSLGSAVVALLVAERLLPGGVRLAALVLAGSALIPSVERSEGTTGFSRWGNRVKFQL